MPVEQVILPRHVMPALTAGLASFRVVVLGGPRQSGKTTVATELAVTLGACYVTLDDDDQLDACCTDPGAFLDAFPRPLFIDEFQRAGDRLIRAIKLEVDRHHQPGQFLLTGSSRFLTIPNISESLAGRAMISDLWPYTQGEADQLGSASDRLVERLLDPSRTFIATAGSSPNRSEYLDRMCRGGYPELLRLAAPARPGWIRSYLSMILQRDVPYISRGRHLGELPRLVRALAATSSKELNVSALAKRVDIERTVLTRSYLPLLENVYLMRTLPAWSRNLSARAVKHPKVYLTDTGLLASLIGVNARALALPNAPALGPLVETFVAAELMRQLSFLEATQVNLYHLRSADGPEVDLVLEAADGRIAGIEVKAATTVGRRDFRHLEYLRDRLDGAGQPFIRGSVLYLGDKALPFGDRMIALPVDRLWMPSP